MNDQLREELQRSPENPDLSKVTNLEWVKVFKSEVKTGNNFDLAALKITGSKLCSGHFGFPIKVLLFEFKANGSHLVKAGATFSVQNVTKKGERQWEFKDLKSGQGYGKLVLRNFRKDMNYAFIDYLRGGMEINLIVAIDLTASNGLPSNPQSLHYIDSNPEWPPNQYQQAIRSVGSILLEYDHDKLVPVYGFGGVPRVGIDQGKPVKLTPRRLRDRQDEPLFPADIQLPESLRHRTRKSFPHLPTSSNQCGSFRPNLLCSNVEKC